MHRLFNDPLLSITRKLLRVGYILLFASALLLLVAGVVALTTSGRYGSGGPVSAAQTWHGGISAVAVVPLLVGYGWMLRLLRAIVDTVAAGTPFVAANADRLARMGWLALAVKIVMLAEALALYEATRQVGLHDVRFSGPSLLMILVLFILARVFRQGAAMREDLEGTV